MKWTEDGELVTRAAHGDHAAFEVLVQRHQSAIYNVAYRMLGNRQEAEDAAQETLIRAYRALRTFDAERPLAPWLKRIAVNVCLNYLTDKSRNTTSIEDQRAASSMDASPEDEAAARERQQKIRQEILNLPAHYRAVIELRHYQNLSYAEIAETLKRPLSDVKSDLFRARRLLAQRFKELKI